MRVCVGISRTIVASARDAVVSALPCLAVSVLVLPDLPANLSHRCIMIFFSLLVCLYVRVCACFRCELACCFLSGVCSRKIIDRVAPAGLPSALNLYPGAKYWQEEFFSLSSSFVENSSIGRNAVISLTVAQRELIGQIASFRCHFLLA
ncbi:hypothetical protein F5Y09DRAFT_109173 [Xylaria sp. FL1042]|nr:hypothetical protein F5Y09DRAFT_109173 [Xylaria sp. FL1042]